MKIIQVYDSGWDERVYPPTLGGVTSHIFFTSKHLARMGHQVTVLERKSSPQDPDEEDIQGIRFVRTKARRLAGHYHTLPQDPLGPLRLSIDSVIFALWVNGLVRKINPDILHLHHRIWSALLLVTLNRPLRRRTVYTAHTGELGAQIDIRKGSWRATLFPPYWPYLYLTRRPYLHYFHLMQRVRKVVVLNEKLRTTLIFLGKVRAEDVVAIHAGADIETFHPHINAEEVKEKYGLRNKVTVLFVGTVIPRKGVGTLVKAIEQVVRVHPNVVLLMAGDLKLNEEYSRQIAVLIEENGLREHVRLLGYQEMEELRKLYAACDIFVSSSLDEGFTAVLTEAMSCGKALIGTKVGGASLQVKEGWNGFLVEPGHVDQLAERIGYLADHPELRKEMGVNSRKLAEEEFDWSRMAEKLEVVYQEVVAGRPG